MATTVEHHRSGEQSGCSNSLDLAKKLLEKQLHDAGADAQPLSSPMLSQELTKNLKTVVSTDPKVLELRKMAATSKSTTSAAATMVPYPPGYHKVTIDEILPVNPLVLDEETKATVRALTKRSFFKDIQPIAADYVCIALIFAAGLKWDNPYVWAVLSFLMATRQHGLLILMHEATHGRILKTNYWNSRLSNFLFSWPFVLDSLGYRQIHMKHHRYLYTEDDPDIAGIGRTYAGQFPKTMLGMVWLIVREFLLGYILTIKYLIDTNINGGPASTSSLVNNNKEDERDRRKADEGKSSLSTFITYYVALFTVVSVFGLWRPFFWLWIFPMASWLQVILRLRFVSEHFGVEKTNALNLSRNNLSNSIEGFLLTPHNVNYHIAHHIFPNVPCYNLPAIHRLLWEKSAEYRLNAHHSYGMLQVLRECTIKGQQADSKKQA